MTPRVILAWLLAFGGLVGMVVSAWPTAAPQPPALPTPIPVTTAGAATDFSLPSFKPPKTAIIVDQLSVVYPNSTFVQTATNMLEKAGYQVTYIPHDEVTVNFYRTMPTRSDDIILLRVHGTSVILDEQGEKVQQPFVYLATGEPDEESKYLPEKQLQWIGRFMSENTGEKPVFIVMDPFFKQGMQGNFDNSIIVMMGCDGMRGKETARLFVNRGAKAVVGWTDLVSIDHTDKATLYLLKQYLVDGLSIDVAADKTFHDIGPDPGYKSELRVVMRQG
jgi:hypothetical protein